MNAASVHDIASQNASSASLPTSGPKRRDIGQLARRHARDDGSITIQPEELIPRADRDAEGDVQSHARRAAEADSTPSWSAPPEKHRGDNKQRKESS